MSGPVPKAEREGKITGRHIRDLCEQIARKFNPQKIILFGSHAYGKGAMGLRYRLACDNAIHRKASEPSIQDSEPDSYTGGSRLAGSHARSDIRQAGPG